MTGFYEWCDGKELDEEQKKAIVGYCAGRIVTLGGVKIPLVAICDLAAMSLKKPKAKLRSLRTK